MLKNKELILVGLIGAVAVFFRFWNLASLPPGLHPDEAANGLDIIRMIENKDFRIFYNTNGPREAFFFYLQSLWVFGGLIFKISALTFTPLALRLAPAVIGVLTVLGLYWLLREWLERKWALAGAFFLAVSSWHIQLSRNGFRAILVPLITVFFFYFLSLAIRRGKTKWFCLSGLFFGLGFHSYLAFYMILPLGLFFLIYLFVWHQKNLFKFLKTNYPKIILAFIIAGAVYLPLQIYFLYHPGDQLARATGVSIFKDKTSETLKTLWENTSKTLLMFNFSGDTNFRHNYAGRPMLDPLLGILFVTGLVIALRHFKNPEYILVIFWWFSMLLPSILTRGDIPHALRTIGAIPPTFIIVVLGLRWLFEKFEKITSSQQALATLSLVLIFSTIYSFERYFVWWANDPRIKEAYSFDMTELGYYFKSLNPEIKKYALVNSYSNKTLSFVSHDFFRHPFEGPKSEKGIKNGYQYLEIQDLEKIRFRPGHYQFAIQNSLTFPALEKLKLKFPQGNIQTFYSQNEAVFTVFDLKI